jgi:hypothetical protein
VIDRRWYKPNDIGAPTPGSTVDAWRCDGSEARGVLMPSECGMMHMWRVNVPGGGFAFWHAIAEVPNV